MRLNRNVIKYKSTNTKNFFREHKSKIRFITLIVLSLTVFITTIFIKIFSQITGIANGFTQSDSIIEINGKNKDEV